MYEVQVRYSWDSNWHTVSKKFHRNRFTADFYAHRWRRLHNRSNLKDYAEVRVIR